MVTRVHSATPGHPVLSVRDPSKTPASRPGHCRLGSAPTVCLPPFKNVSQFAIGSRIVAMRTKFVVCLVFAAGVASSAYYMQHIFPTNTLRSYAGYAANQMFEPTNDTFNSMVSDDFSIGPSQPITGLEVAFETTPGFNFSLIQGWRITIWRAKLGPTNTNKTFTGPRFPSPFTAWPQYTTYKQPTSIVQIFGTQASGSTYVAAFTLPNLTMPAGHYWVSVIPEAPFVGAGQVFLLDQPTPMVLGAGTPNDSCWSNPLNGFGAGTFLNSGGNASFSVY